MLLLMIHLRSSLFISLSLPADDCMNILDNIAACKQGFDRNAAYAAHTIGVIASDPLDQIKVRKQKVYSHSVKPVSYTHLTLPTILRV